MARTAITTQQLVRNGSILKAAGTAVDQPNGMVITKAKFKKLSLEVANSAGSPFNIILRAGVYPVASMQAQGDLTIAVTNATTRLIGPLDSAKFAQADGSLNIDFGAGFTGTIIAYEYPHS